MIVLIVISETLTILFNPLFGGIGKALTAVISYIIEPDGAWIPFMLGVTTSFAEGILIGVLWRLFKKINKLPFIVITGLSAVSFIFLFRENAIYNVIFAIIFIFSDIFINKDGRFTKIYICLTLSGFIAALVNDNPYDDIISVLCFKAYIVTFITNIYYKIIKKSPN